MKGTGPSTSTIPTASPRRRAGSADHGTPPKAADTIDVYIGGQSAARLSPDNVLVAPVERERRRDIAAQLRLLIWALENR